MRPVHTASAGTILSPLVRRERIGSGGAALQNGQHGAALLLVLWLLVLLTALVGSFALSARIEAMLGRGLARDVVAAAAARAGVDVAIWHLHAADPAQRWVADGRAYEWEFGTATVTLRVLDETGKVDVNAADAPLLAALIRAIGVPAARADALAAAIVDWRDADDLSLPQGAERAQYIAAGLPYAPRNAPFETLAELQLVLGMEAGVYARLRPNVTIHTGLPLPNPRLATADVLTALGVDVHTALSSRERPLRLDAQAVLAGGSGTVAIEALARLGDGRQSRLHAVVRTAAGAGGAAYMVLEWNEGALLQ